MNRDDLHNMRTDYSATPLTIASVEKNPMNQFEKWFAEAIKYGVKEPNAFSLATVSLNGKPSVRIVLVKEIHSDGIVFYTNYESQKGTEIQENPNVSACFFWQELSRQIRINGQCEKISPELSDVYFNKRPIESQIGAITSPQSKTIPSRDWLLKQWESNKNTLSAPIKRPENWGGFKIKINNIEFWQGQLSRLHDRILFQKQGKNWNIKRLAP